MARATECAIRFPLRQDTERKGEEVTEKEEDEEEERPKKGIDLDFTKNEEAGDEDEVDATRVREVTLMAAICI